PGNLEPAAGCGYRLLELRHEHAGTADDGGGVFDVLRGDRRGRARDDDDGVLAGPVIDENEGAAGRLFRRLADMDCDPLLMPGRQRNIAEGVLADLGDAGDGAADAGRGDRLVRALAARAHLDDGASAGLDDRG